MIMMRPTSAPKTGKPPPPVPPRPSKINSSSDSLGRTKRFAPDVPHKPTVPFRSAPPPPSSRVYQLREAFTTITTATENGDNNKVNPIVKSQSYSAVNFSNKPSLERSISQDGNKKSRTVIFESSNLKNTIEIKRQDSDRRIEKVQVNGTEEPLKENKLDGNKNEIIKNECGYTMDIMHEMLADAIKKDMDEENKTKITVHSDDDSNIKDDAPKATVLIIEDKQNNINEEESKKDDVPMKESDDDSKSNASTGERKKDRHVKFDDKMNHEHLIDELQNMKLEQERILKRQRKPSKDIYENEAANNTPINKDKPKILHSDWIEVNDGEEVRLSSCQITIDERRETKDEISVDSLTPNSVEPLISRLATMSNLHGLPPLPKSLSNFNFLEGPPTPNRSRNPTPPMSNTGTTHLVYPPHPKPMTNGGTTQGSVSNLDAQLAILRREMVSSFSYSIDIVLTD
ncbi:hypothetical protein MML48_4g00014409 [Holotrichia oblita]|uniref:Uncharacterized protein n=1 Tax=Holotrichia oblita TaxID=644536 RepID=A0ACB9T9V1_HOLOL|nr:hypothetical protein MML48_4g00014409 [Holotrichia oblita]